MKIFHHNVDYTPYEGMDVKGWLIKPQSREEKLSFKMVNF